jgi:7-keto-8-aminopelargonate synthetase-like enzyme
MTEPEPLQPVDRTYVLWRGRKLSYFAGCDYFRLASHPEVIRAARQSLNIDHFNVAASRLTTGNHVVYQKLERALMRFFRADAALLVPTGYLANLVAAESLAGNFTHALLDEAAHSSLQAAARLLECKVLPFRHCDPGDLARKLKRLGGGSVPVLLTDGMFARNGRVAPLRAYVEVLPKGTTLLVDDCHGVGVLGPTGRGTLEYEGIPRRNIIQTLTLSKAFGVFGGAILTSRKERRKILSSSRIFAGSTPLPLPLARAALAALGILERDRAFKRRLDENQRFVRAELRARRYELEDFPGPIIPFYPRRTGDRPKVVRALLSCGIHPPFIRYPGGPPNGFFRFVISSEHSQKQLESLCACLGACRKQFAT